MVVEEQEFSCRAHWIGEGENAIFCWIYNPKKEHCKDIALILCPPFGHEYIHSHRTYRHIAEGMAKLGVTVVRFDYSGTGDSAGEGIPENFLALWQKNISDLQVHIKNLGIEKVGLFGVRLGGSLAMMVAQTMEVNFVAVWNPILRGSAYARELRALSQMSAQHQGASLGDKIEVAGFPLSKRGLESMADIRLEIENFTASDYFLLLNDGEFSRGESVKDEDASGMRRVSVPGFADMLAEPHYTQVPDKLILVLGEWCASFANIIESEALASISPGSKSLKLPEIEEKIHRSGSPLFAISTHPDPSIEGDKVLVLINAGSVHHVGPNRLYVEIARELARVGILVVRVDLGHLGDSCVGSPEGENHPYAADASLDVERFCYWVKSQWPDKKICLSGVCSGAYLTFNASLTLDKKVLDSILIMNPLTFLWHEGLSLDTPKSLAVNSEASHYKSSLFNKNSWMKFLKGRVNYIYLLSFVSKWLLKSLAGMASLALELIGGKEKRPLARKLEAILSKGIAIDFVFSTNDPGYSLLLEEGGYGIRKLKNKGRIGLSFISEADHTFTAIRYRKELVKKIIKVFSKKNA